MAEVGSYYVTVMPNMNQFNSALRQGAAKAGGIIGSVGLGTALGNALTSGFNSFLGTLDRGVSRLDTLESFPRRAFTSLLPCLTRRLPAEPFPLTRP